jgi:hypothetical protein
LISAPCCSVYVYVSLQPFGRMRRRHAAAVRPRLDSLVCLMATSYWVCKIHAVMSLQRATQAPAPRGPERLTRAGCICGQIMATGWGHQAAVTRADAHLWVVQRFRVSALVASRGTRTGRQRLRPPPRPLPSQAGLPAAAPGRWSLADSLGNKRLWQLAASCSVNG